MTANANDDELAALRADFEALRKDLSELSASFKAFLESQAAAGQESPAAADTGGETAGEDTGEATGREEWEEFRRKLDEARAHGEQAVEDLGEEVARHPLASVALAFGIGYLAARILHLK
ncbi:hypothetical protein QVG61_06915 [Thiohalobacter sp. IOR34]|uniref:hypothetical protein n=1 Tax=Thiohalobacter sp. IOR34 TaxID=3057176 RepID=UPI0025AF0C2D|nr:hypothetical protein [Thiohalobacter sp. IOR34]WJW74255.1 hypothetical protein QVG61_06915 [Thiohalobacter sp. IOR34]